MESHVRASLNVKDSDGTSRQRPPAAISGTGKPSLMKAIGPSEDSRRSPSKYGDSRRVSSRIEVRGLGPGRGEAICAFPSCHAGETLEVLGPQVVEAFSALRPGRHCPRFFRSCMTQANRFG